MTPKDINDERSPLDGGWWGWMIIMLLNLNAVFFFYTVTELKTIVVFKAKNTNYCNIIEIFLYEI